MPTILESLASSLDPMCWETTEGMGAHSSAVSAGLGVAARLLLGGMAKQAVRLA